MRLVPGPAGGSGRLRLLPRVFPALASQARPAVRASLAAQALADTLASLTTIRHPFPAQTFAVRR